MALAEVTQWYSAGGWAYLGGGGGVLVQNNFTHSLGMAGRVGLAETIYGPEHLYVASP